MLSFRAKRRISKIYKWMLSGFFVAKAPLNDKDDMKRKTIIINKKINKMEKNELIAKINETLAEEFEVEVSDITPEANIKETLQLDSLSLVDMVALIESEFGVKIKGAEMVQVQTFQALYDFIAERTA